jgi:hypothetical protein
MTGFLWVCISKGRCTTKLNILLKCVIPVSSKFWGVLSVLQFLLSQQCVYTYVSILYSYISRMNITMLAACM